MTNVNSDSKQSVEHSPKGLSTHEECSFEKANEHKFPVKVVSHPNCSPVNNIALQNRFSLLADMQCLDNNTQVSRNNVNCNNGNAGTRSILSGQNELSMDKVCVRFDKMSS